MTEGGVVDLVIADLLPLVQALLLGRLHIDVPDPTTDLIATGLLDSLGLIELLLALQQEYGIAISVDELDLEDFRTAEAIARLLESNLAGSSSVVPDR
jgi:D-alanine--poly(phosphoribitol) ligase subunit 2